jgi:hypothetical protein
MQKEKQKENRKLQKGNKNQILITCSPATAPEKGAC